LCQFRQTRPNDEKQKRYIVAPFSILAPRVDPLVSSLMSALMYSKAASINLPTFVTFITYLSTRYVLPIFVYLFESVTDRPTKTVNDLFPHIMLSLHVTRRDKGTIS